MELSNLGYKDRKLAVIEAKSDSQELGEGVAQADAQILGNFFIIQLIIVIVLAR